MYGKICEGYVMMKEKDEFRLEPKDDQAQQQEIQGAARKAGIAVVLIVVMLFAAVMFITYFFEIKFGKTAGTAALVIIALIIAFCLYRKEIMEKLKRKKQDGKR